ncbi:S9 family peptidase [Halorhodospira halophila]|uniref:Oligopeptidase B, Serine peptidase, MEROPS family S09A n=1 Tax=Halorhodospira halophila (strain DSM 244 / SL1) TaxID=349124 RepID=A1WWT1_HALHL|nr:S9 family peptidase [Halorhodospira halophila]ABM62143.1 oligopeptidase B, Serine peptidase, MEROPS family S09A [Halorhodospira halophila SL1]MBK1729471.1 S9 family peptidase [Halorhodospira halophila]
MTESTPQPPRAAETPEVIERFGVRRTDPYAWLRDPNWREAMLDPQQLQSSIRAHLEAENAYTEAVLQPVAGLRERLFAELRGRIKEEDASVPDPDGAYEYYVRFRAGGQHPVACRRPRGGGAEEVLLDGDALAEGHAYFQLGDWAHSDDHRYLAYAVDTSGAEAYTIRFRDLAGGADLPDALEQARGDFVWAGDGQTLLYTVLDDEHRPRWVYRHCLGTDSASDALVYEETDPGFFVGLDRTESRRYVLIETHDHTTSEVHAALADDPAAGFRCLMPRERGVEYAVSDSGDRWLILTNRQAQDFRIVQAPLEAPEPGHFEEVVPHRPGVLIHDMLLFREHLVRLESEDALPRIVVRRLGDGAEHSVAFDEAAYALGISGGFEYDTTTLRFSYSSLTTPGRVYDYDMETRVRSLRKEQEIPSGHDPAAYVAHRIEATAPDGERVPISLVHRADLQPGPDTPLWLNGYGAYGISQPAAFSPHRLSLVDRGFVFAIAHVRGGKERGYRWYDAGKLEHKPNTFSDYIACAEHLIDAGYTGAGRVVVHGGSAGGMLVGAVLNQRPELFGAAVADVPFVDVLNTMSDPSLPLTPPEWPEWGNPIEDERAFHTILGYSPYENIQAQAYPPILATAGVSDPRVTYWEPAKWVARLRALKTDDNPLLLQTNMSAGHAGPGGRFDYLEEAALRFAFVLWVFGRAVG